jgi:threonine dehydrogenase-like Zn-dependent dehydrogenase
VVFVEDVNPVTLSLALEVVRGGGTVVVAHAVGERVLAVDLRIVHIKHLLVHSLRAYPSTMFVQALRLMESGGLSVGPVITHVLPLADYARAFDQLRRHEPVTKILLMPG